MNVLKRLCVETDGQNLVEYTLLIGLVVLILWTATSATGESGQTIWSNVNGQLVVASS
jgi:Flp pilus assembly pilin Flp